jgi:CHASE1-domain containing sensor protein/tRNA A-37 threonylcarbamoyl transferase component Bud32
MKHTDSLPAIEQSRSGTSEVKVFRRFARDRVALAVAIVGIGLSVDAFFVIRGHETERFRFEFERRASQVAGAMRAAFGVPLEVLHSIPALYASSDDVTRSEFRAFVQDALRRQPAIRALEWIPLVPHEQRAAFEARGRADGLDGFRFTERAPDGSMVTAGVRDEYRPLYFRVPHVDEVAGFDVATVPANRDPTDRARDAGVATASPRFHLVQDPPEVYSAVVYHPIYRSNRTPDTPAERRAQIEGFGAAVFTMEPVVRGALEEIDITGLDVALLDASGPPGSQLLFETAPGAYETARRRRMEWSSTFPFADRQWQVTIVPRAIALPEHAAAWAALVGGTLLSLLVGMVVAAIRTIVRLRRRVRRTRHLGQYRLEEEIGAGGMGRVYRASHAMLRRPTAVKVIRRDEVSEQTLRRFAREVQFTSQLTHPNTIQIYDYGRTPEGVFYYAMEYLEGLTLTQLIADDGPQTDARVIYLLRQACQSLGEAHEAGLVHRDIKPGNIMLCHRGGLFDFVKVLDFGLVREVHQSEDVTVSGIHQLAGTPHYMSPEAARQEAALDARSDLYQLGAVAYFLLVGEHVFTGATGLAIAHQHAMTMPQRPSERAGRAVAPDLEGVVMQCLHKEPERRPATARLLRTALEACALADEWGQELAREWWEEWEERRTRGSKWHIDFDAGDRMSATPDDVPTIEVDLADRGRLVGGQREDG